MPAKCEACEDVPVAVEEPNEDGQPFRVCLACHDRLLALALRPVEWFNLTKRHGWGVFLLHDDFYGDDGTAYQPRKTVESPEQYPAPKLSEICDEPDTLFDFTFTQWHFTDEVALAWRGLDRASVLRVIERRFQSADLAGVKAVALEIAACTLAEDGRDFVSTAWENSNEPDLLEALAQASAACLTFEKCLMEYAHRDSVPRVKKTVEFLVAHSEDLAQD